MIVINGRTIPFGRVEKSRNYRHVINKIQLEDDCAFVINYF